MVSSKLRVASGAPSLTANAEAQRRKERGGFSHVVAAPISITGINKLFVVLRGRSGCSACTEPSASSASLRLCVGSYGRLCVGSYGGLGHRPSSQ